MNTRNIITTIILLAIVIGASLAYIVYERSQGAAPFFFDIGQMSVDIFSGQGKTTVLKVRIILELSNKKDMEAVAKLMPRIKDILLYYIKDLRKEDLIGSSGMYRIRQDVMLRINKSAAPVVVQNVLFTELVYE